MNSKLKALGAQEVVELEVLGEVLEEVLTEGH